MPTTTGALVNVYVTDVEASTAFYRDVLGFTESFRTPLDGPPTHTELRLGGFTLGLGAVDAAREVHHVEPVVGAPAMALVVWTDDVDALFADVVATGSPGVEEPHDVGNGNRAALVRDPDGTLVELVAKVAPQ